jgi:hypothetical protein
MNQYDETFVLTEFDPADESQLSRLGGVLGARFQERESSYHGGTYYRAAIAPDTDLVLRRNVDLVDNTKFEAAYPTDAWILDIFRISRSPYDVEAALRSDFPGVVLHAAREHQPESPARARASTAKRGIFLIALPTFTNAMVDDLGVVLGVHFEEGDMAGFGGWHFVAADPAGGRIVVFKNYEDEGEAAYPEVPLGTWLVGFFPTQRALADTLTNIQRQVAPDARVARAPAWMTPDKGIGNKGTPS